MSTESLLTEILAELKKLNAAGVRRAAALQSAPSGSEIATDAELDDPRGYGDPTVKRDFKRWTGATMIGKRFSETSAEYLDGLASFKDWQASKDDEAKAVDDKGRPKSHWARKDARLARGWSRRLRAGWTAPSRSANGAPSRGFDDADDMTSGKGDAFESGNDFGGAEDF